MVTSISGPVTGGIHGWPFAGASVDLAARGWVEEEYFIEGEAPRYRQMGELDPDGRWKIERVEGVPFKTRAIVRRPVDPTRFSGTVVVEWNNVSAGCEIAEAGEGNVIFEEGLVWVGVSAQRVGVHGFPQDPQGLLAWDPERYGTLHIEDDGLSFGVFSEVAKAVASPSRPRQPRDPLNGLEVRSLMAIGGSQSASRLVTYINAVQPLEEVFDGFIPFTWFGSRNGVDDRTIFNPAEPSTRNIMRDPTRIRDDLGTPVLVVNSECEAGACFGVRQPDADLFRYWEVAGAPHGPRLHMEKIMVKMARNGLGSPGGGTFDPSVLSPVPWAPVLDAGIGHMHHWMNGGPPPPSQPVIEMKPGTPPTVKRDASGNAIGGIRVPELAVPLGRNIAEMVEAGAAGLMGQFFPFDDDVVKSMYPTQKDFESAFESAANDAVAAGVLRPSDAQEAVTRARATRIY